MTGGRTDATNAERANHLRELDSRTGGGLQVRLLWSEDDNRVWVAVIDARSGESFRIAIRDGERPMDVFRHPYAYAAVRAYPRRTPTTTSTWTVAGGFER